MTVSNEVDALVDLLELRVQEYDGKNESIRTEYETILSRLRQRYRKKKALFTESQISRINHVKNVFEGKASGQSNPKKHSDNIRVVWKFAEKPKENLRPASTKCIPPKEPQKTGRSISNQGNSSKSGRKRCANPTNITPHFIDSDWLARYPGTKICQTCTDALNMEVDMQRADETYGHSRRGEKGIGSSEDFKKVRGRNWSDARNRSK